MKKLILNLTSAVSVLASATAALAEAVPPPAVAEFYQAFMAGDAAKFQAIAAKGFTDNMLRQRPEDGGFGNVAGAIQGFKAGFPDLKIEIEHLWQDGATTITKTHITGTNTAPLFGQPATGKAISISAIDAFEIVDGKIVNLWHVEEISKLFEQLKTP